MGTSPNKNTKWVILGSIVLVLALLIAVGPILFSKYMRTKWEKSHNYKVANIIMTVSGQLLLSRDNVFYIKGDNNQYYVLENFKEDLSSRIGQKCSVQAKMRMPENDESIDGNGVRLFLEPNFIKFGDEIIRNSEEKNKEKEVDIDVKEKSLKKAKLRLEVNAELGKPILFDVIKGKVSAVNRQTLDKQDIVVYVLKDNFGDSYMLYKKKNFDFSNLENQEIICLGREILPPSNMPLVVDEVTFEIYEVYDLKYNKLM